MINLKSILTIIFFFSFTTIFCQNCSVAFANNFIINQVDKKYKINSDTTQKTNDPFAPLGQSNNNKIESPQDKSLRLIKDSTKKSSDNIPFNAPFSPLDESSNNRFELPYSKKLLKDSTKRIETKFFNKILLDWCFYETEFKDMGLEGVKKSLVAINSKQNTLSKITILNGIVDDNFLDVFKNITIKKNERSIFIEEFFNIISKTCYGHFWYRQIANNDAYIVSYISGGQWTSMDMSYFFYFSDDNKLLKIEVRSKYFDRHIHQCYFDKKLDTFLKKTSTDGFMKSFNVDTKGCLSTDLLKQKLPDYCFYEYKSKHMYMEYGFLEGMLAINFKNNSRSIEYWDPGYSREENKKFWTLFYNTEVKEFEQAEFSREILHLFEQVFHIDVIQTVNPNKNIVSFIAFGFIGGEYDFYFEDNKLKKIMRGWGNNKKILE